MSRVDWSAQCASSMTRSGARFGGGLEQRVHGLEQVARSSADGSAPSSALITRRPGWRRASAG